MDPKVSLRLGKLLIFVELNPLRKRAKPVYFPPSSYFFLILSLLSLFSFLTSSIISHTKKSPAFQHLYSIARSWFFGFGIINHTGNMALQLISIMSVPTRSNYL